MGLSEPKKREILAADPRNTHWSEDKQRFGFKMLEKMGWSEGKGLGAKEDGVKEHVKIKLKTNNHGIGADKKNIRNWLANADGFSELLSRLNTDTSTPVEDESAVKKDKKSKNKSSKEDETTEAVLDGASARLSRLSHRARFRKMKQMAVRDEKGLQEILGVRSAPATIAGTPLTADSVDEASDSEKSDSCAQPSSKKLKQGVQTISTGVSVSDYFAHKIKENPALAAIYGHNTAATSSLPGENPSVNDSADSSTEESKTSSKKRKSESQDKSSWS
ncbi:hypothetical protein EDC05_003484 [Coemansia umbellata]|nr:hypothetical protein EDC05_003484 [Coemansia umbellata]